MPKMNAPSRMRIGHGGRSGLESPRRRTALVADDGWSAAIRRRPRLPSSCATIACTPSLDAAVEVVRLELRRHDVADDAARRRVGQRAFEAVADLDAHLAVVRHDDDEHAVVLALLAELPRFEHARRVLLDALAAERGHRQHHDLVGGLSSCALSVCAMLLAARRATGSRRCRRRDRSDRARRRRPTRARPASARQATARRARCARAHRSPVLANTSRRAARSRRARRRRSPLAGAARSIARARRSARRGAPCAARIIGAMIASHSAARTRPSKPMSARTTTRRSSRLTSSRMAVRPRRREELRVEELHLRVLPHLERGARCAQEQPRERRHVDAQRARTAPPCRDVAMQRPQRSSRSTQSGRSSRRSSTAQRGQRRAERKRLPHRFRVDIRLATISVTTSTPWPARARRRALRSLGFRSP